MPSTPQLAQPMRLPSRSQVADQPTLTISEPPTSLGLGPIASLSEGFPKIGWPGLWPVAIPRYVGGDANAAGSDGAGSPHLEAITNRCLADVADTEIDVDVIEEVEALYEVDLQPNPRR